MAGRRPRLPRPTVFVQMPKAKGDAQRALDPAYQAILDLQARMTGGGAGGSPRIVSYTATGTELPGGFTVPIGETLTRATYTVGFFGVEADIIVPWAWSFPVASKTASRFQARFAGDGLTAGGIYYFQLVEA